MESILELDPFYSEKIWGYEKWNLSTHKAGHSLIKGSNSTLLDTIGSELPILIKIIQANDTLSVQVHPDDNYSRQHENDNGKTECWYVLEAKEGASLICGIKEGLDKSSFENIIKEGNIESYLQRVSVKAGDMIYIPSGTVHAIEGGLKLIEVQQSSDITYRIHDWGRDRDIHIEKSLEVIDYNNVSKGGKIENFKKLETSYFTVEKIDIEDFYNDTVNNKFHTYTVISGDGYIYYKNRKVKLNKEDTIYINSDTNYTIEGKIQLIKSYI